METDVPQHLNRMNGEIGFKDKTLLVSGGTGFMGKVFVEKILRTCPSVKRIYLLIRTKKGRSAQDRLKDVFNCALFDLLKKTEGDEALKKVVAINGDVLEPNLGISEKDRQTLADEVQMIYHLAATIRFDDPLAKAIKINVRGTKFMLDLAKQCTKLLVFNHVSTAYCHLNEKVLYEKVYPPPADPHMVMKVVEWMDEEIIDTITKKLLDGCPNTYAFSKALGEALAVEQMDNLPLIIFRPSVVIPMWQDPLPGWIDNINGPAGLLIAAGKGVLRSMYCNSQRYADFLPVDIAVNALILGSIDYLIYKERRIYNCTSSFEYKVTWEDIVELGRKIVTTRLPLNGVVWYPGGSLTKSRLLHNVRVILFHYIPAIILDSIIYLSGNKPVLWRVQQRITKGFEVFEYYANNQWEFNNDGSLKARELLTRTEREIFKVDGQGMDLVEYFYNSTHCSRLYILKEPDSTIAAAKRHMKVMWVVQQFTHALIILGFIYFMWQYIFNPLMNMVS